jgi:hypothetical protein
MIRRMAMGLTCLLVLCVACAAQIGVGSTREEVVAALGQPTGRSSMGAREVLNYPEGRVFLRDGRVDELDAALIPPAPVPPAAETPTGPPPAPAVAPVVVPKVVAAPPPEDHAWIKHALITVCLCVILLLGRHWIRVAKRAQAEKKTDLLSR